MMYVYQSEIYYYYLFDDENDAVSLSWSSFLSYRLHILLLCCKVLRDCWIHLMQQLVEASGQQSIPVSGESFIDHVFFVFESPSLTRRRASWVEVAVLEHVAN
jgi:hypothetical protein